MGIDLAQFERDGIAIIADLPASALYAGRAFDGALTDLTKRERLTLTGAVEGVDAQFIFPVSAITANHAIKEGDRIGITPPGKTAMVNYRITEIQRDADGKFYSLTIASDRRS